MHQMKYDPQLQFTLKEKRKKRIRNIFESIVYYSLTSMHAAVKRERDSRNNRCSMTMKNQEIWVLYKQGTYIRDLH